MSRRILIRAGSVVAVGTMLVVLLGQALPVRAAQGNQGLQGGWSIDDSGNLVFPHSLQNQLPLIVNAGAGWVRINFRLGGCFANWSETGCGGKTALGQYDILVNDARARGLKVLGLLSGESWPGTQADWTANNAENVPGGNGDNPYLQAFSQQAAVVLVKHFQGRITTWQVWNEPNVWETNPSPGVYQGGSFIYPSNFAWLLRHVYEDTRAAGVTGMTFVSGGVVGHDPSGLQRVVEGKKLLLRGDYRSKQARKLSAYVSSVPSGADYLTDTYEQGILNAGWNAVKQSLGSYPLDAVGQHLYIDQYGRTSAANINAYLNDLRQAYVALEGGQTAKKTIVTEIGWTTAAVNNTVQSDNLKTAYTALKATSYLTNAYWFSIQDVPEASLYFGLQTGGTARDGYTGKPKPSFKTYQKYAAF